MIKNHQHYIINKKDPGDFKIKKIIESLPQSSYWTPAEFTKNSQSPILDKMRCVIGMVVFPKCVVLSAS